MIQNIQNNNVNLWFAKNKDNKTILINEINDTNKHDGYTCPICKSEVIARTGTEISWHFAHRDGSKCSSETMIHWWVKNELLKKDEDFKIDIEGNIRNYKCKQLYIEKEFETSYGVYKPDLTIETHNNEFIFFEITNTNKKKVKDYIDMWEELGNVVVETNVRDMINCKKIEIYKPIYFKGKKYKEISKTIIETSNKEILKGNYNKEQLDKIEWLIDDMCKYVENIIDIEQLSEEIQLIEDEELRNLIVNILKNNKCKHILNDYVNYNINKFKKIDGMEEIYSPNKIYDRVYGRYEFYFSINNKRYPYKECINDSIKIYKISEMLRIINNSNNNYFLYNNEEFFDYENILYNYNNYISDKILRNYVYINTYDNDVFKYYKVLRNDVKDIILNINKKNKNKEKNKIENRSIKKYFLEKFSYNIFNKINIKTDNYIIYFYIKENNIYITSININEIINDDNNEKFKMIIEKIKKYLFINKLGKIYKDYIQKLNKKYELVNRQPFIILNEYYNYNEIGLEIEIKCKNKDNKQIYSKVINEINLDEDIGYDKLSDKISDSIRNYIYRNNKKEK